MMILFAKRSCARYSTFRFFAGLSAIRPDSGSFDGDQHEFECGHDTGNGAQAFRTAAAAARSQRPEGQSDPSTHTGAAALGGQHTVPEQSFRRR